MHMQCLFLSYACSALQLVHQALHLHLLLLSSTNGTVSHYVLRPLNDMVLNIVLAITDYLAEPIMYMHHLTSTLFSGSYYVGLTFDPSWVASVIIQESSHVPT